MYTQKHKAHQSRWTSQGGPGEGWDPFRRHVLTPSCVYTYRMLVKLADTPQSPSKATPGAGSTLACPAQPLRRGHTRGWPARCGAAAGLRSVGPAWSRQCPTPARDPRWPAPRSLCAGAAPAAGRRAVAPRRACAVWGRRGVPHLARDPRRPAPRRPGAGATPTAGTRAVERRQACAVRPPRAGPRVGLTPASPHCRPHGVGDVGLTWRRRSGGPPPGPFPRFSGPEAGPRLSLHWQCNESLSMPWHGRCLRQP